MTRNEALSMIKQALEKTTPGISAGVGEDTHLTGDKILDSLEIMNFLFELEQLNGSRLEAIDETFDDFRVSRLIEILTAN